MNKEASSGGEDARWVARPMLAFAIRLLALIAPLLVGFAVALTLGTVLPSPAATALWIARWMLIAALAVILAIASEQVFRRLVGLATLLRLPLGFPGPAPSRLQIAVAGARRAAGAQRSGTVPDGFSGDSSYEAEQLLELLVASAQTGWPSRTHADRVRILAAMLAQELQLPQQAIDRMQWALLLREFGASSAYDPDGETEVVRWSGLAEWLGPWKALLSGPLTHASARGGNAEARTGRRLLAVADTFVVLSAVHPYRRSLGVRHARDELQARAGSQLDEGVVDALLTLPSIRLRLVVGALPSPRLLLRRVPAQRPIIALVLGSLVGTVVFMITGPPEPASGDGAASSGGPASEPGAGTVVNEPPSFVAADPLAGRRPPTEPQPSEKDSLANTRRDDEASHAVASATSTETAVTVPRRSSARATGSTRPATTSPSGRPPGPGGPPSSSPSGEPSSSPSDEPSSSPSDEPSSSPSGEPSSSPSDDPSPSPSSWSKYG